MPRRAIRDWSIIWQRQTDWVLQQWETSNCSQTHPARCTRHCAWALRAKSCKPEDHVRNTAAEPVTQPPVAGGPLIPHVTQTPKGTKCRRYPRQRCCFAPRLTLQSAPRIHRYQIQPLPPSTLSPSFFDRLSPQSSPESCRDLVHYFTKSSSPISHILWYCRSCKSPISSRDTVRVGRLSGLTGFPR